MKKTNWKPLVLVESTIPSKPDGLWTLVFEYIEGPTRLKFKATGKWCYAKDRECGPDGDRNLGFPQEVLVPGAPLGALVCKIGGSTADKPDAAKQTVFTVGSECVVSLDEKVKGIMFVTMNDAPSEFDAHDKEIELQVWEWPAPSAAPAPHAS
jgi:hypothetical protein